ncbi:unnamed protein product, partial [Rotaria sp. Silwood1]
GGLNQGLIDSSQRDINKYCQTEVIENYDEDNESDEDIDDNDDNNTGKNNRTDNHSDDEIISRKMSGEIIQCLRLKYINTSITLESQCVSELVDVIQTAKLDGKLDIKLYQSCRKLLNSECTDMDQEDCLKLLYQKNKIDDDACIEQVKHVIK